VDRDRDSFSVRESGVVCAGADLPAPYLEDQWFYGLDCDDTDPTRWTLLNGYADADTDGFGAEPLLPVCSGEALAPGYASVAGDCAPNDGSAWRPYSYAHRDADSDGYTIASAGPICIGEVPPAGYSTTANGDDCDDATASVHTRVVAYVDSDGDGVGAGASQVFCTDGSVPPSYSAQGTDCAPEMATLWQLLKYAGIDSDGDGYTKRESGELCAGATLPAPYYATATGNDCEDTKVELFRFVVAYADGDGDGVGAPPRSVLCLGPTLPGGWSTLGYDSDDSNASVQSDPDDDLLLTIL
jgi:hypothetical protein